MSVDFIPFALPEIGEEEEKAVLEVLKSGWITTGKVTLEFENEFDLDQLINDLKSATGVVLLDNPKLNEYPTASYLRLQVGVVTGEFIITRNQLITVN